MGVVIVTTGIVSAGAKGTDVDVTIEDESPALEDGDMLAWSKESARGVDISISSVAGSLFRISNTCTGCGV